MNFYEKMFLNRSDAGRKLADLLSLRSNQKNTHVIGIPRGGVSVAFEIAQKIGLVLDVILVKKLAHPMNDEVAIGAVSLDSILLEHQFDYDQRWLAEEIDRKRIRIKAMMELYQVGSIPSVKEMDVILVDDGVATGFTLIHAINLLKEQNPKSISVAVPVCPNELVGLIETKADAFYCLERPIAFQAIGQFYQSFNQVDDKEVKWMLSENKKAR